MIQQSHRSVIARRGATQSLEDIILGLAIPPTLYIDASREIVADDTTIATLTDYSGNGRNLPVGAGEIGASFRTNVQNGLGAYQWKGVSACGYRLTAQDLAAAVGSGGWGLSGAFSLYMALKVTTTRNGNMITYWDPTGTGANLFFASIFRTDGCQFMAGAVSNDSFILAPLGTVPQDTAWHVWAVGIGPLNTDGFLYDYDGSVLYSDAISQFGLGSASATFGFGTAALAATVGNSYLGHIGEYIICRERHNQATRESILFAMADKWGM